MTEETFEGLAAWEQAVLLHTLMRMHPIDAPSKAWLPGQGGYLLALIDPVHNGVAVFDLAGTLDPPPLQRFST